MSLHTRIRPGRRVLAAMVATLAAVSLAACSAPATAGGSKDGSGEVTFFSWDNEETMAPLIEEFEKQNPGTTIKFSYAPPVQEYIDTLQKRLLAGNAADVFILGNLTEQVGGGYVADLTGTDAAAAVSDFSRKMRTYDDKVYGISVASWGGGFLVNRDLLAEVGITEPPQSWDDFLELCRTLQAAGIAPLLEPGDGISTTIMALIGSAGKDSDNLDAEIFEGEATFSEAWTDPLETWSQLYGEGLVTKDAAALKGDQVADEFYNERVAMIASGSWSVGAAREALPDADLEFWPVPGVDGEPFWAGAASPPYAINAKAENPVGAQKFLDFLASEDGSRIYHETTGSITTTNTFTPELDPALDRMYEAVVAGDIYCTWQAWPGANTAPLDAVMLAEVQKTMLGQADAATITSALDDALGSLN